MMWVDHSSYFGPDRRRARLGMRLRERRKFDCAGLAPPLRTALRQLRMRVLEARGPGLGVFIDRANGTAVLADIQGEHDVTDQLSSLSVKLARARDADMRPMIYEELDRANASLRAYA